MELGQLPVCNDLQQLEGMLAGRPISRCSLTAPFLSKGGANGLFGEAQEALLGALSRRIKVNPAG
ncbi:MAG: hypothetical protein AB2540_08200 [Candidatus Thiodiazotropha endolucinida]